MAKLKQKRIAELDPITSAQIDTLIKNPEEAAKWSAAIDYVVPDPVEGQSPLIDQGTRHIPMNRIALLTKTHLVPQNMLPHKVDNVIDGTMAIPEDPTGDWVFTDSATGTEYVCPGPAVDPQKQPVIDNVYRDVRMVDGKTIYTQYRYVADPEHAGEATETGHFVPIPSDLVMKNGVGTFVVDNDAAYTRQIDIEIGTPSTEPDPSSGGQKKILFVDAASNTLRHSTSGVTAGTYPANQATTPDFGGQFKSLSFVVDSTGHVTTASSSDVTLPSTPARTAVPGLVQIGDSATSIGSASSPGTYNPSSGYVLVSAADHKHNAASFSLINTNDGTKTYNGSAAVSYDFDKFLKVPLPSAAPAGAGLVLTTETSGSTLVSVWKDTRAVIQPSYAFIDVSGTCTSTASALTLATPSARSSDMNVSSNKVTGLVVGKVYVVTYSLSIMLATAGLYLDELIFAATFASSNYNRMHIIDESITGSNGIPNHVNGSMTIVAAETSCSFKVACTRAGVSWSTTGSIQIAEVK